MGTFNRGIIATGCIILMVVIWMLVSIAGGCGTSGCEFPESDCDEYTGENCNVRSGSKGHGRGYYHGGKY